MKLHTLLELRGNIPSFIHISGGKLQFLCHPHQAQPKCSASIFSSSRASQRRGLRSNSSVQRLLRLEDYQAGLRRIRFADPTTNNFALPALTFTELYLCRWQVELFFKWVKQHLCIKSLLGTSEDAVKTQIWIAVSVYVLVAIVRKRLNLQASLYEILLILSLILFDKIFIYQLLMNIVNGEPQGTQKQLFIFD